MRDNFLRDARGRNERNYEKSDTYVMLCYIRNTSTSKSRNIETTRWSRIIFEETKEDSASHKIPRLL